MKDLHLVHTDFSYSHSDTYELSILFRQDGISFIITGQDYERLFAIYHESFDINSDKSNSAYCNDFFEHEAFTYRYKKISCLFSTERITIVPASLYKQDDLETIFRLNHPLQEKESLVSYTFRNAESFVIYPVSQELLSLCTQKLGIDFQVYPHIAPLFESAILQNKHSEKTCVYISIQSTFFDVLILKGPRIALYNTFTYTNINDYVFYVMNVFEQLHLNPMQIPVILTGKTSPSYIDATAMFIKHVETISQLPSHTKMIQQPPFTEISFPFFHTLFCSNLCE